MKMYKAIKAAMLVLVMAMAARGVAAAGDWAATFSPAIVTA
jgi:hypothetical protein